MLIPNGHIQFLSTSTSGEQAIGIDENTGFPVVGLNSNVTTTTEGTLIECQFKTVAKNNNAVVQGNAITTAEYTALISEQSIPENGALLKLFDSNQILVGKFGLLRADKLEKVGHIKLYLKNAN